MNIRDSAHDLRDLQKEEHPFNGPAPDKRMDERARSRWTDQANGEPDADTTDCSEHDREENKKDGVALKPLETSVIPFARELRFAQDQEQSTPDRKMRHEDMDDGNDRNQQARAKGDFPHRVVHGAFL